MDKSSSPTGLTHLDASGDARMVDVSAKPVSSRRAVAQGYISLNPAVIAAIENDQVAKGNVFAVARTAGILAAKQTSSLIPMCHPLLIENVAIHIALNDERTGAIIEAEVTVQAKTGVEMEALTAVSVTALTIYDMCKALDKGMRISDIHLVSKEK